MPFQIPDVAIGAVAAALLTAVISLLGLIISKEQKVSDLRQAWIDALRADLSKLIARANALHGALKSSSGTPDERWQLMREDSIGINEATAAIRLRLNPSEPPSKAILDKMVEIESAFRGETAPDFKRLDKLEKQLVDLAAIVLKSEWTRVRDGEPVFRVAKAGAALLSLALVLAAAGMVVQTIFKKPTAEQAAESAKDK
jgi:hypothetical protein